MLRGQFDADALREAKVRGRERSAPAALAGYGITRQAGARPANDATGPSPGASRTGR
jgi:hypothetical protein